MLARALDGALGDADLRRELLMFDALERDKQALDHTRHRREFTYETRKSVSINRSSSPRPDIPHANKLYFTA